MPDKTTPHILVLDDDPFMLKLLRHMLNRIGYTDISTHHDAVIALDWIRALPQAPDMILLDLNMPAMDGVEFVRHLVTLDFPGSLILISGEEKRMLQAVERLVQAHNITVLGHLQKPVQPDLLAGLLHNWQGAAASRRSPIQREYDVAELRAALDHDELVNYYHPIVSVSTGALAGLETLVRWRHPRDGLVGPNQFIELAERYGLIDELTRQVLNAAFKQASIWLHSGLDLRIAINVSMNNLAALDFADFVADQAARLGMPPQRVMLELTESRLMQDDQRSSLESLTRLRLKRFGLSIDDFGTGHSSLTRLHDLPFDELKIDQRFVHRAWSDSTARAMYDASLGLARQLGLSVVAEGVEDQRDWEFVRRSGCQYAQGYWIAYPMPAAAVPEWLDAWQARMHAATDASAAPDMG